MNHAVKDEKHLGGRYGSWEDGLLPQNESNEDNRHYEDNNEEEVTMIQNAQIETKGTKVEKEKGTELKEITTENRK